MFVDLVKVTLISGKGGNGLVSFRREKHVPLGGPAGGDGGRGGNVIFRVDTNKSTLLDIRFNKRIVASDGEDGKNKKMSGANGADVIVDVPLGTIVKDASTNEIIADLTKPGQSEIVLLGGKGGRGNFRFASSRNSAPEFAENGEKGTTLQAVVELKVLADCGLVGLPSVGKSTILSVVSQARPEIADYPFTTLAPNLGLVQINDYSFVMADLPGLIEDAHKGKGLGIQFLRHIERCRVLIHVLDMGNPDPITDFKNINQELKIYNAELMKRPMIVVANKMDEVGSKEKLKAFKKAFKEYEVFPIIALLHEGLLPMLASVAELLKKDPIVYEEVDTNQTVVYRYQAPTPTLVKKEKDGVYRVIDKAIENLIERNDMNNEISVQRVMKQLRKFDLDKKLREAGVCDGDTVIIADFQFDFVE